MEMPVNSLQQALAGAFNALGGYATEVWFVTGSMGAAVLTCLALLPLLPARVQDSIGKHPWMRTVSSDGVFLVVMLSLIVIVRLPGLTLLQVNFDDSNHTLVARTLLGDPRFWISAEAQSVGPISILALMLPGLLGFPIDYTSNKVIAVLTWCGVSAAMFLGFRWLYAPALARVFVLPLALTAASFSFWDYVPFNGEHMSVLGLAIAFMLQSRLIRYPLAVLPGRSFAFGATLALIPFTKVQAAPIAVAWGLLACGHALASQPKRIVQYVYGAAFIAVVILFYLVATGAWHDFWQSYILNNVLYAKVGWNASQQDQTLLANVLSSPRYFLKPPDSRGMFLFAAAVFVLGVAWSSFSARIRRALFTWDAFVALSLVVVAAYAVLLPKNNWTHYLLLLFVPVSMLTAAVLNGLAAAHLGQAPDLQARARGGDVKSWMHPCLLAGFLAASLGGFVPAVYSMLHGNAATRNVDVSLRNGKTPDAVTAAILRYASPGEPVAHWGPLYGQLCAAGVTLGTREAMNERAYYPSGQQDYYLDRWIGDVINRRPRVLVDSAGGDGDLYIGLRLENYPKAHREVVSRYALVEEIDGFHIYTLRNTAH